MDLRNYTDQNTAQTGFIIVLYSWRETHFVIKTYILFEPTDPNRLFSFFFVFTL